MTTSVRPALRCVPVTGSGRGGCAVRASPCSLQSCEVQTVGGFSLPRDEPGSSLALETAFLSPRPDGFSCVPSAPAQLQQFLHCPRQHQDQPCLSLRPKPCSSVTEAGQVFFSLPGSLPQPSVLTGGLSDPSFLPLPGCVPWPDPPCSPCPSSSDLAGKE